MKNVGMDGKNAKPFRMKTVYFDILVLLELLYVLTLFMGYMRYC